MRRFPLLVAAAAEEYERFMPLALRDELAALADPLHCVDLRQVSVEGVRDAIARHAPEVILAGWSTPPLPDPLPASVRYVCHLAGSVKKLVTPAHLARGLIVTNWGDSISRVVAECALYHVLACLRRGPRWSLRIHREGGWRDGWEQVSSLFERRVGIRGFGPVARALVELLRPFGCAVAVLAPDLTEAAAESQRVRKVQSLDELFSMHDIVIELAPLIPETMGTVTERHLRLVPAGGVFVNVGRAGTVDELGLIRVAEEGCISIGLDVYHDEPLPVQSRLRGLPNVSVTPHIGGPTLDRYIDAGAFALRNLRAFACGQPLQARITPDVYRSST